jgi:hypothetical protein
MLAFSSIQAFAATDLCAVADNIVDSTMLTAYRVDSRLITSGALLAISTSDSQMADIQMPIGSIGNENVAVRSMRISDFVNLYMRRKNIYNHRVIQRNYTGAQLFSPDKLTLRRIHRKEIAFHAREPSLMGFHCAYEMTLCVARKELAMNNVNVFAAVKNHELVPLRF